MQRNNKPDFGNKLGITRKGRKIICFFFVFYVLFLHLSYVRAASFVKNISDDSYSIYPISDTRYIMGCNDKLINSFFCILSEDEYKFSRIDFLEILYNGMSSLPINDEDNICVWDPSIYEDYPKKEEPSDEDKMKEIMLVYLNNSLNIIFAPFKFFALKTVLYANNLGTQCAVVFIPDNHCIKKIPLSMNKFVVTDFKKINLKHDIFTARVYGSGIPYVGPYVEVPMPSLSLCEHLVRY